MSVRIKLAETTEELDAVFRLRHRVLVEEEGYVRGVPEGRLSDRFDAYPTTANVIAVVEGQVVGAIRFMEASAAGTSADEFFDFRPHLPPGARIASSSMLVVARAYRKVPRLVFALNGMGYSWAAARGVTHLLAPANPQRRAAFEAVGHKVVAPEFFHRRKQLPVLPMILEVDAMGDRFLAFVRRQGLLRGHDAFDHQFHVAGEDIVQPGAPGECAFVVLDGHAAVLGGDAKLLGKLGPGELFGGAALFLERPSATTVRALTDVDLLVLSREALSRFARSGRLLAEGLVRLLAVRLARLRRELLPAAQEPDERFLESVRPGRTAGGA
jgi:N-acyl-L-homoserine lactone synthetase